MFIGADVAFFVTGFLPLSKLPILRLFGGTQFRKFCVIAMFILTLTVWITCYTQEEKPRPKIHKKKRCAFSFSSHKSWRS